MSTLLVAAAVVIRDGTVLVDRRKPGTHLEGAWEFPGGKVEAGEAPEDALRRELREELGVEVAVGDILDVTFHRYGDKAVLLLFYEATLLPGSPEPRAIDVAEVRWAGLDWLRDDAFPPADLRVLAKVRVRLAADPARS